MTDPSAAPSSSDPASSRFSVTEWQVWYVFATYLSSEVSLCRAAEALVSSGLSDAVMLHDGRSYFPLAGGIATGSTTVTPRMGGQEATIALPKGPSAFGLEGLYAGACFRFHEAAVFGEESPEPYLRAFLGECILRDEDSQIRLYPIVKLYASGVLLIELRILGGDQAHDLETFIREYVNGSLKEFGTALVPPVIAALAPDATSEWETRSPIQLRRYERRSADHKLAVAECTERDETGEFQFAHCPLPTDVEPPRETAATLALTLATVLAFVVSRPRRGLSLLALGQRSLLEIGTWSMRPHVHLLAFEGQGATAAENEERHGSALGSILARSYAPDVGRRFLTSNHRPFSDFGVYMNRAVRLWVHSTASRAKQREVPGADRSLAYLVYQPQAVAELLEYSYVLYRRLVDAARSDIRTAGDIAALQVNLAEFEGALDDHVHAGEIRDLLAAGYVDIGIPAMKEQIAQLLAAKRDLLVYHVEESRARWSTLLTVAFGLLAIPPVATEVLTPAWTYLSWWQPTNPNAAKLFLIGVALLVVIAILGAARWIVRRRTPRRPRLAESSS